MLDTRDPADTLIMDQPRETLTADADDAAPKHILHYKIRREIGRGPMSVVYEALDTRTGLDVALKLLTMPPTLTSEEADNLVARFEREARTMARLSHPNVVRLHEIGVEQNRHFLAMEYLPGQTLRERMGEGTLAPRESYAILTQLAAAVDAVHKAGIIHRDVKPTNVMLLPDGTAKLLDFGIARSSDETRITHTGVIVGSPSYMAPEQIKGEPGTAATDLWALGVMSYEMLTGHLPFTGQSVGEVMYQIMHQSPATTPDLPIISQKVLRRALDKTPSERFPTAAAFVEALKPPVVKQAPAKPRLKRAASAPRPISQLKAGAALMALFLLGYFGVVLTRHQQTDARQIATAAQTPHQSITQVTAPPRVFDTPELDDVPTLAAAQKLESDPQAPAIVEARQETRVESHISPKMGGGGPTETVAKAPAAPGRPQAAALNDVIVPQSHRVAAMPVSKVITRAKPVVRQTKLMRVAETIVPLAVRPSRPMAASEQRAYKHISAQGASQHFQVQTASRSEAVSAAAPDVPAKNATQNVSAQNPDQGITLPADGDGYDPEADARQRKSAWSQSGTSTAP